MFTVLSPNLSAFLSLHCVSGTVFFGTYRRGVCAPSWSVGVYWRSVGVSERTIMTYLLQARLAPLLIFLTLYLCLNRALMLTSVSASLSNEGYANLNFIAYQSPYSDAYLYRNLNSSTSPDTFSTQVSTYSYLWIILAHFLCCVWIHSYRFLRRSSICEQLPR
jgi:hypothetical protein